MPTYLCHGFRWDRRSLRIFVILNDLEDAAPDWVVGDTTALLILNQFTQNFDFLPKISDQEAEAAADPKNHPRARFNKAKHHDDDFDMPPSRVPVAEDAILQHTWSPVKLLEEYDPDETESPARPYAYVADHVVRIDLGADVLAEMAAYEKTHKNTWLAQLRDAVLHSGESEIGWYIVVCGDAVRDYPDDETETEPEAQDQQQLRREEVRRPATTATTTSTQPESYTTNSSARPSQDQPNKAQGWTRQDYSHMTPPPIPDDKSQGDNMGHTRRPSLRHRLSKASGLRRLFAKKEGQAQEQAR